VDTIFTEAVVGEIVTEIPVVGSMQVDVAVAVDVVVVDVDVAVVVQVTAVLVAAVPPQEVKPSRTKTKARGKRSLTAPLSSFFEMTRAYGSDSNLFPKMQNDFTKIGYTATRLQPSLHPCPERRIALG